MWEDKIMKNKTGFAAFLLMLALVILLPVRADAAWKKNSEGSYSWYNNAGAKMNSQWFAEKQVGFVTSGNTTYCYNFNFNNKNSTNCISRYKS